MEKWKSKEATFILFLTSHTRNSKRIGSVTRTPQRFVAGLVLTCISNLTLYSAHHLSSFAILSLQHLIVVHQESTNVDVDVDAQRSHRVNCLLYMSEGDASGGASEAAGILVGSQLLRLHPHCNVLGFKRITVATFLRLQSTTRLTFLGGLTRRSFQTLITVF